jgi:hypothetical protein
MMTNPEKKNKWKCSYHKQTIKKICSHRLHAQKYIIKMFSLEENI